MTPARRAGEAGGMDDDAPAPARFPHAHSPYHAHLGIEVAEWREGYARLVCDTAAPHATAPASSTAGSCFP